MWLIRRPGLQAYCSNPSKTQHKSFVCTSVHVITLAGWQSRVQGLSPESCILDQFRKCVGFLLSHGVFVSPCELLVGGWAWELVSRWVWVPMSRCVRRQVSE